jgi:hypothetical protein
MPGAQPVRGAAGVVERLARHQQVQVAVVGIQTAPELPGVSDMTVTGNQPADAGHRRQPV